MFENQSNKKAEITVDGNIRQMRSEEYKLLKGFLYEAIFQPEKEPKIPETIVNEPSLVIYFQEFGKFEQDFALCFEEKSQEVIGVIWVRMIQGYGSIDNRTPELSMSVKEAFRGRGIGRHLLQQMLLELDKLGYERVSLSVQKENKAAELYFSEGFEVFEETDETYLLVHHF